ncbi:MAG: 3-phosphoshikimate 1-carboxyvinyltransferase [Thermoanaerobaculia bacterium]
MSHYLVFPPASSIRGSLRVPSSKSATNRALVLAALTEAPVEIVRPLESDDTAALRRCLTAMGASIEAVGDGLRVSGPLGVDARSPITLDAGDSGTAARFLTAVCAATPGRFLLTGSERLCERPIGALVTGLAAAGAQIAYAGPDGRLPLRIEGGLRSGLLQVDASQSSQFLSAILLAAVAVEGGLAVQAAGTVASAPYVGMTLDTLRAFGHEVVEGDALRVRRGAKVAARYEVPGDYSSAVALLAAVGAAGGSLELKGLRWPSLDPDAGALPVLERMGIRIAGSSSTVAADAPGDALAPVSVEATHFPDSVPALAALAALARGESRFLGIGHLRLKESDRIAALAEILRAAGAAATAGPDTLTVIGPARARGLARIPTHRDHRMAMAAALLCLRVPELMIENPSCVSKSYPAFFRDLDGVCLR